MYVHPGADVDGDHVHATSDGSRVLTVAALSDPNIGGTDYDVHADLDRDGQVGNSDYSLTSGSTSAVPGVFISHPDIDNIVGYNGYLYNQETGYYTVRYRDYDPTNGRFLQRDPLGYADGSNLYEYVGSSPMVWGDPYGLISYHKWENYRGFDKNGRSLTNHYKYQYDFYLFGWFKKGDMLEKRWTYNGSLLDNKGQTAYQRKVLSGLNQGSAIVLASGEIIKTAATVALVFVPGPEDIVIAVVGSTKVVRIAGEWYQLKKGEKVEDIKDVESARRAAGDKVKNKDAKKALDEKVDDAGKVEVKCFAAGTLVLTEDGLRPIEDLREGDKVLSYDETTGEYAYKTIDEVIVTADAPVVELEIEQADGHTAVVRVTERHAFWVPGSGWVRVRDLSNDMVLLASDGDPARVVSSRKTNGRVTVYNIEVADYESYFVSPLLVCVHNAGGPEDCDPVLVQVKVNGKEVTTLKYQSNPKHRAQPRQGSKGRISAEPTNPVETLGASIKVKDGRRVGFDPDTGEFVVFQEHLPGEFHGYTVDWKDLEKADQQALINAGKVNLKGKPCD